jgi:hypothetical protein
MSNSIELRSINTPDGKVRMRRDTMLIHSLLTNSYSIGITLNPRRLFKGMVPMQGEESANCERPE